MFELKVSANFSAAHQLRKYRGKCAGLHGHNWKVEVFLRSSRLDKIGMIRDAREVKKILNNFLEDLDHKYLNKIPFFKKKNPTSENIAVFIYGGFKKMLPNLAEVRVHESDSVAVSYKK